MKTVGSSNRSCNRAGYAAAIATARQALSAALALLEAVDRNDSPHDADRLVRVVDYTRGLVPRRVANLAAASGQISGSSKPGKFWIAKASAVDSWLASSRPAAELANDTPSTADDYARKWMTPKRARRAGGAR